MSTKCSLRVTYKGRTSGHKPKMRTALAYRVCDGYHAVAGSDILAALDIVARRAKREHAALTGAIAADDFGVVLMNIPGYGVKGADAFAWEEIDEIAPNFGTHYHVAFKRDGTPVIRMAECEGKPRPQDYRPVTLDAFRTLVATDCAARGLLPNGRLSEPVAVAA